MEQILELYASKLARTPIGFKRYLYDKINWDSQLIVIVGLRGVGKSTMVLQRIKMTDSKDSSMYVSADNTYFSTHKLFDFASDFSKNGGRVLYIDEVHKYPGWSTEVKMMYDNLPDLKVVVTGSSILEIAKATDADLSRRAIRYTLEGMSFREYINFSLGMNIAPVSLDEILAGKVVLPDEIIHPIALFKEYLSVGYFPFFKQDDYYTRLENVVNQTVEVDIPSYANMNVSTALKLKKLLYVVSQSVPFKPNFTEIGRAISTDRNSVADYLVYLEKAGLLRQLKIGDNGMAALEKVEKIYLSNTTLISVMAGGNQNTGNVRETFFFAAMSVNHKVMASSATDFIIGEYSFEVGGKNKTQKQIASIDNAYVIKDDIEYAYKNIIPLWMFGMNY